MVLGNISRFTEGFTSFTADDDLMIANLKQALNYSKESIAIPDPSINITNPATTKASISSMNSNMRSMNNTLPTNISSVVSGMATQTFPTNTNIETGIENEINADMSTITTMPQMTMAITTRPTTTQPSSAQPIMTESSMTQPSTTASITDISSFNNVDKFNNIKRVMNDSDENDEEDSDDENAVLEEEDRTNVFEDGTKKQSTTRRQSDKVEGFRGSMQIESKQTRNILLALLLSCIGYLIVYSMGNNLLPLDEISPQLKKFKRLVYAGLFFLITFICLEVF